MRRQAGADGVPDGAGRPTRAAAAAAPPTGRQAALALKVPRVAHQAAAWIDGIHDAERAQIGQWLADAPALQALYLWGEAGSGKSHALDWIGARLAGDAGNTGDAAAAAGGAAAVQHLHPQTPAAQWQFAPACAVVLVDDVDRLDAARQHALFALLVAAQQHGRAWVCTGRTPAGALALREDLRSRVLWGPTIALPALDDAQLRTVLAREARRRGIALGPEVLEYLMRRAERDFGFLAAVLDHLDRYALAEQRPVTVPLVRRMLAEEGWADPLADTDTDDTPSDDAPPPRAPAHPRTP